MRKVDAETLREKDGRDGVVWTAYRGQVYDITNYISSHPGGALIRLCAGRDASQLIDAYHPSTAKPRIHRIFTQLSRIKLVGQLRTSWDETEGYYATIRARVERYMAREGLDARSGSFWIVLEFMILVTLYLYTSYIRISTLDLVPAVIAGICIARIGFIMHMGNHAAVSPIPAINAFCSFGMDLVGMSAFVWRYEHQVAHHLYPNVYGIDNDCAIGDPLLRFSESNPKAGHRLQALSTLFLMSFGLVKWLFIDFYNMFRGKTGSVAFHPTTADWVHLFVWKFIWIFCHIALPIYWHGFIPACLSLLLMLAVAAQYMENIFIVNHIQPDLVPKPGSSWSTCQLYGSANWSSGSLWGTIVSGGLNHQIEHHLFPTYSIYTLYRISGVVQESCKEFGLPYNNFNSFSDAWISCFTHLNTLGESHSR